MIYVYLMGRKVVLYPLLSSILLFNVIILKYDPYFRYDRVWVFGDLMCVHTYTMVESGHYLYRYANWSLYPGGVKIGECPC